MADQEPDPTPEEIEAACRAIQAGWSDAQRLSRATGPERVPWVAPEWLGAESSGVK